jgi:hypothetical protein
MKITFAVGFPSNSLDFQNGEYHRSFERKDQPFDVTDEEWKTLKRTGQFEPVQAAPAAPAESEGQSTTDQQSGSEKQSNEEQPPAPAKRVRKSAQNNQQSEDK